MASYEADPCGDRRGPDRLYPSVQRDAAARGARPGPIAAALEDPRAFYGLIVDGEHVAPAMLRLALRGAGQAMLVTDAMPPVGGCRDAFLLGGKDIVVQRRPRYDRRRHTRRLGARHGERGAQLRSPARAEFARGAAVSPSAAPAAFLGLARRLRPHRARLSRRSRRARPRCRPGLGNLGRRRGGRACVCYGRPFSLIPDATRV